MHLQIDDPEGEGLPRGRLLAVDLGLRAGLAMYEETGKLIWYRSTNFGRIERLKRAVYGIIKQEAGLEWVVLEGGGNLAEVWKKEAGRRGVHVLQIDAGIWRRKLMYPRNRSRAKYHADRIARQVIQWSNSRRPTSLRHDAAEAILIGLWGVLELGWLEEIPVQLEG